MYIPGSGRVWPGPGEGSGMGASRARAMPRAQAGASAHPRGSRGLTQTTCKKARPLREFSERLGELKRSPIIDSPLVAVILRRTLRQYSFLSFRKTLGSQELKLHVVISFGAKGSSIPSTGPPFRNQRVFNASKGRGPSFPNQWSFNTPRGMPLISYSNNNYSPDLVLPRIAPSRV